MIGLKDIKAVYFLGAGGIGMSALVRFFLKQGKSVEAKQYLLSLKNNYEGDDDIAAMIESRLKNLK